MDETTSWFGWWRQAPDSARRALWAAALGWMLDAFDVMLYALVLTAVIRDLELTRADVELAVAGYYVSGGSGPDVLGQEEFTELVGDQVRIMMMIGAAAQPGDLVGRRLDRLVYRS